MESMAFVYCRISQDRDGEGLGVARQEEDCRQLASEYGLTVAQVFVDNDASAYSGKKRPAYSEMLSALEGGKVSVVLCWHTDRLHRSPKELEAYIDICEANAVRTLAVKSGELDLATDSGRMIARMLGAAARYESDQKATRVQRAMQQKAMKGEWLGGTRPFGWQFVDGAPEHHPVEAAIVADVSSSVLRGESLGSIVVALNASGITTSVGKPWGYAQLRQMLVRPRNAGLAEWKGEIVGPSTFPALVSEDVWRAVVSILTDPRRRRSQSNKARHLLAGIAQCHCGALVRSGSVSGRNREKYTVYRCPEKGKGHVGKRVSLVDSVVDRHMVAYRILAELHKNDDTHTEEAEQLETEAAALRERLNELALLAADGRITTAQLVTSTAQIRAKLDEIESRQAAMAASPHLPRFNFQLSKSDMGASEAAEWFNSSVDTRRDYVKRVCNVILLPHGKGSSRVFDANTVQVILKTKLDARGPLARETIPGLIAAWREAGITVAEGAGEGARGRL